MKFLINNNTTYNYSYYATRPKWLVDALFRNKECLPQKEFLKPNKGFLKEPFSLHSIAFAPRSSRTQKPSIFVNTRQRPKGQANNTYKCLTQNRLNVKGSFKKHLFQTKELLCWTSDLSFFNLRGYFSNILKALQICRFAVRNNKKILFIKGGGSNNGQGKQLNSWLVQYKRSSVPQTLSDLFSKPNLYRVQPLLFSQILSLKKSKTKGQKIKDSNKMINLMKDPLPQQEAKREAQVGHLLAKKKTAQEKQNSQISAYHKYYQLSRLLNRCFRLNYVETRSYNRSHFRNPSVLMSQLNNQETSSKFRKPPLLSKEPLFLEKTLNKQKKTAVRINNVIKLWIKEAQTMSQQTAAGLTMPLTEFLTNTKTTFNTVCNLSNNDLYNSVNSNLKSSSLLNEEVCEINTNRLERVNNFQKSCHLFSQPLAQNLETPALITTKYKSKDEYRNSNVDNTWSWWVDYSSSHIYLPLTPGSFKKDLVFFKDKELVSCNKPSKKQTSLEYCFFGDLLTWQLKSQKRSSIFYTEIPSKEIKDGTVSYLKKQVRLGKRKAVVLKKEKRAPFFTSFKKHLQTFKSLRRKLKEPLKCLNKRKTKEQRKSVSLKKRQFLSTLAKFIVFYFSGHTLSKDQTKRAIATKANQKSLFLPSLSTIKTKVKIIIDPGNFHKHNIKPAYGYNLAFLTPEFNKQDKIKSLQGRGFKEFFKTEAPSFIENQKNQKDKNRKSKVFAQKRERLRTLSFYRYYKTIIALNHLNQYKMFAKTPFINNRLADIIFFINPEKNQRLVNQANGLKIPTVGIVSGNMTSALGRQGYNNFRLKESVYYPILGNPTSSFFTRAIMSLIVKCLRVEKSKNIVN